MRILNRSDWSESKPISTGVTSVVLRRRSILQAPKNLLVEEALRWAQVVGWDGSVEVRGKYNAVARRSAKNPQNRAFEKQYRELLAQSGRSLRQWMQEQELGRSNRSF
jgi:hypothetical protein